MTEGVTPPIPLEDAQARLLAMAAPLPVEDVPMAGAAGRYLAAPLVARRTQPAADLSAMDGYALRGDGPWRVVGESRAGHPWAGALSTGESVRISTGAIMPDGADTVLIQEEAAREGDTLSLAGDAPAAGRHIRRAGMDFREGDELLAAGTRIGPAAIALALSGGHGAVQVRRRPRVTVIDCGDELARDPVDCAPHQIPASNGAMLAAMTSSLPCRVERVGPVADDLDSLARALSAAAEADLVVISGGASVGDHDLVRPALEAIGAKIDFWRAAIKPGKPLMVARKGAQVVLGLPGNPVSAFVTGFLFMLPLLRALSGSGAPLPRTAMLPLAGDIGPGGPRREFLRARWNGEALVPIAQTDSAALHALAAADALIDRPAHAKEAKAGTYVPACLLENGSFA